MLIHFSPGQELDGTLDGTNEDFNFEKLANDCGNLADSVVNFPDFFGIVLFVNGRTAGNIFGKTRYEVQLAFDKVSKKYPVIWIDGKASYDLGIVIHEMAHGFGVKGHSYYYGLSREPGFGNRWNGALHCGWSARVAGFNCVPIHLIGASKYEAGLIPESRVITVAPKDPVARITLERLAQPQTSNPLMIKIPVIGTPDRYFTIEARQKIGYDDTPSMPGDAILIHDVWPSYYLDGPGQTDSHRKLSNGGYGLPGAEGSM